MAFDKRDLISFIVRLKKGANEKKSADFIVYAKPQQKIREVYQFVLRICAYIPVYSIFQGAIK
jgi:hypothetical protein